MTNTSSSPVTDAMVERAWAAIVGADVAGICFQASIIRADLRTALEAVISPAQPSTSPGSEHLTAARNLVSGFMLPERITDPALADDLAIAIAELLTSVAQTATREALEEINALISNGDRPTVNERNAFEHFTVLNRLLLNIRDIARRALSSVPSPDKAPIGGTESCTCHFLGAGMHHIPGCPYYTVVPSNQREGK